MEIYSEKSKNYFRIAIGSALGLGLSPVAPGTAAALLGVIIHVLFVLTLPASVQWPALLAVFLLVCFANHVLTPWAEDYYQCKDPKNFVLDEVAGYLLVPLLFVNGELWKVALWGFFLFRILDVLKIAPPAKYIDRNVAGSWGILLDDLVSAAYAVGIMYIVYHAKPGWIA